MSRIIGAMVLDDASQTFIGHHPRQMALTAKEYAAYWGVHRSTVIRWIKSGKVKVEQPGGKRGRLFILVGDKYEALSNPDQ